MDSVRIDAKSVVTMLSFWGWRNGTDWKMDYRTRKNPHLVIRFSQIEVERRYTG